ncbi:UPF0758 domain-containing protein [Streptomyces sp. NPDC012972]
MPVVDRLRERLWGLLAEALAGRELPALLLGSGRQGRDVVELAGEPRGLARAGPQKPIALWGMGPAEAARCCCVPTRPPRGQRQWH